MIKQGIYRYDHIEIKRIRRVASMTQKQLADYLGVAQNSVSRWELRNAIPNAEVLAALHSLAVENKISADFFKSDQYIAVARAKARCTMF